MPIDFAGEGDAAFFDFHFNGVDWNGRIRFQTIDRRGRDFFVAVPYARRQLNLDLLGNRLDVLDPARSLLRRKFFREGPDMTHERHDAGFCGYADMSGIDTRLSLQFVKDGLFQLFIVRHGNFPTLLCNSWRSHLERLSPVREHDSEATSTGQTFPRLAWRRDR